MFLYYQYNIFDYNTNNDQSVNVLDLCRSKAYVLEKNKKTTQSINISCLRPWVTSDGSIITIPVNIKGNTEGVSSLSFYIEYNNWYFKLDSAYSSYGQVSYSSVNDYVQFTAYDGKNVTEECNIVYLVFSTVPDVPYSTYEFNLSDIQGTVLGSDGNQRELSDEEYNSDYARLQYTFSRGNSRPDVTTTPSNTTVVTTSSATETTVSQTEPQSGDKLSFSMDNAELSSDGKRLRIPVYMQKNTTGLYSFNAIITKAFLSLSAVIFSIPASLIICFLFFVVNVAILSLSVLSLSLVLSSHLFLSQQNKSTGCSRFFGFLLIDFSILYLLFILSKSS